MNIAARVLPDKEHDAPSITSNNDQNVYTLGEIGMHGVVIAGLPAGDHGTSSAAAVARDMLRTFPNVRIGLLVGIGGGVPTGPSHENNIRLGDVAVSSPGNGFGGVFQYDYGTTMQDRYFKTTGHLDNPPRFLTAAVASLRADHKLRGTGIKQEIDGVLQKMSKLKKTYQRPEKSPDQLFYPEVLHGLNGEGCCAQGSNVDPTKVIERETRTEEDDYPAIHYGLIASGNQLAQDASMRDTLATEKGVLCFEREAAGLMNHFPCLVVRGISNYADTHSNNKWEGYADMTAAVYAKSILKKISLNEIEAQERIVEYIAQQNSSQNQGQSTLEIEDATPSGSEQPAAQTSQGGNNRSRLWEQVEAGDLESAIPSQSGLNHSPEIIE